MAIEPRVVFPHEEVLGTPEDIVIAANLLESPNQRTR
jgi:hypothetical protein